MIDGMAKTLQEPAITKKALVYFLDELTLHPQATEILAYCRECNVYLNQLLLLMARVLRLETIGEKYYQNSRNVI